MGLARDPRMRRAAQGGMRLLGQAIKSRRARRRTAGKRVVFPYLEQNLAAVRRQRARTSMVAAPVAVGTTVRNEPSPGIRLMKQEYTMPVRDSDAFAKNFIVLAAGNDLYFPSLASLATQYQFYKFMSVTLEYSGNQGTTQTGQVVIAPVANYSDYTTIASWDQIVGLPHAQSFVPWSGQSITFPASYFNCQTPKFKAVVPSSSANYSDQLQTQGFVAIGVRGCSTTATKNIGELKVKYTVQLFNPRSMSAVSNLSHWYNSGGYDMSATYRLAGGDTNLACVTTGTPGAGLTYTFTYKGKRPLLFIQWMTSAAATAGYSTWTATANCTTTLVTRQYSASLEVALYTIEPTGAGDATWTVVPNTAGVSTNRFVVKELGSLGLLGQF